MSATHPDADPDPETYVRENKDTLVRIIKHGNDRWTRAMAMAALVEYGDDPDVDVVREELDRMKRGADR